MHTLIPQETATEEQQAPREVILKIVRDLTRANLALSRLFADKLNAIKKYNANSIDLFIGGDGTFVDNLLSSLTQRLTKKSAVKYIHSVLLLFLLLIQIIILF